MNKIAVVANCCSNLCNILFIPFYLKMNSGIDHDLIIVHMNFEHIDKTTIINNYGNVIFVNKILENGNEIQHKAYGSYKFIFNMYKDKYDVFCFLHEGCVIRRHNWIKDAIQLLDFHDKIGFCASQIFNGNELGVLKTNYPHKTHIRGPGPIFIKTKYLNKIKWDFNSDHEGEMVTGNKLVYEAECIGIQIGNKINYAYDTLGMPPIIEMNIAINSNYNHISQLLEYTFFKDKKGIEKFEEKEYYFFENLYSSLSESDIINTNIISPFSHINKQNVFNDIQPFNNLLYLPSLHLAKLYLKNNINYISSSIITINIDT